MKSPIRVDSHAKLTGRTKYIDDYREDCMLEGAIFFSPVHAGKITKIVFPTRFDLSEFTIVLSGDIPGENIVPEPVCDQLFLVEQHIGYKGQPILAVAHPDRETVRQFVEEIRIEVEPYEALTETKVAMDDERNAFGNEIVIDHGAHRKVDPKWIFTRSVYYTPHQEQAYLEPQGMLARYDDQTRVMHVRGTMQCPYFVKSAVDRIMGNKIEKTIVQVSEGIGGAFGGKEDFPNIVAGLSALLSYKSGKPVKIVLDRAVDIQVTTKRHPSRTEIQSWIDPSDHSIRKLSVDFRLDAGFYQTLSPVVLARGVLHAGGCYRCDDVYIRGRLMRSNTPPNGAFRGFGAPQSLFAIESHIDDLAHRLKVDPLEFRRKNLFSEGDPMPTTQAVPEDHIHDALERLIEISDYEKKVLEFAEYNRTHHDKKGIGLSVAMHGGGYTGNGEKLMKSEVKVVIEKDATVKVYVINTEMGQGVQTTLAQCVAEELGHPLEKTFYMFPDTSKAPDSGPTVASRTIYIIGNLLRKLARDIRSEIGEAPLADYIRQHPDKFPMERHDFFEADESVDFDETTYKGTGYKDYSWAACAVEITYDPDTWTVEPLKVWSVLDIGKVINHDIAIGQVIGGVTQGIFWGLTEYFEKEGVGRMNGLTDYVLPTTLDAPDFAVEFIHTDSDIAKGLGEIPMDFPAAALRNAVLFASGKKFCEIPLIPERIFREET